ncbi:MAG: TRAP transporter large permease [Rhizobiales bacterium]|nr:TRAP transporter large permease [Hyphomicrobiales bacterium]
MGWYPIILLLLLLALNMRVAFAVSLAGMFFFLMSPNIPTELFIQRFVSATHSFPLLAVPFFVLAGVIMNASGVTRRLMALADVFVGHRIGGLAKVNILLSTLMGGMSGSANADAAMQSKILVPEMTKAGYDKAFSTAVTASSSIISAIIPPSIGLILFGYLGNVSIGKLFVAGLIPGVILCVGLMLVAGHVSKIRGYAPKRSVAADWFERRSVLLESFWAILLPIGIISGIRFGFFTPTEAGAAAVVYASIVGFFYRELTIAKLPEIFLEAVLATSIVMLIICAATSLGYYMSWEQIPKQAAEFLLSISDNSLILLLLINALLLFIGLFLEGSAGLILLTPILVPVVATTGIDPVQFGIVMVLNLTIGGLTPPMGTLMFVSCSITGVSIAEFTRAVIPFFAMLVGILLLLTFVPAFTTMLPNLIFG